jgi:PPOX class probable F420-dependent enzyme
MAMGSSWAREKFLSARSARLATADVTGQPHLVPVVYAVVEDTVCFAVDQKPKRSRSLKRLDNIEHNERVSILVDHYSDDWDELWWARADGRARIVEATSSVGTLMIQALIDRYPQYSCLDQGTLDPVVIIAVEHWAGWSADIYGVGS